MREGLKAYMDSERRSFKPTTGDIKANAELIVGKDRPRLQMDPECEYCGGTGFKDTEGKKWRELAGHRGRMKRCDCTAVIYDGQEFEPEMRALPAAPLSHDESADIVKRLAKKVLPDLKQAGKEMPRDDREPSDEEKIRRRDNMLADMKQKGLVQ